MGNRSIIGFILFIFVIGFTLTGHMANADENLNTKLYYNEEYSFSVEYPSGWNVDDYGNFFDYGVSFSDGSEESFLYGIGLWNTNIVVAYYPDYLGEQDSLDFEDISTDEARQNQIEDSRNICNESTFEFEGYTCKDFRVVEELPSATSIDGYPIITTVFSMTKDYEDFSQDVSMVGVISDIYVGNDLWEIYTESDEDVFNEHEKYIIHLINSFKHPASPPVYATTDDESNGGGCLIATATYGSELAPQVQQLRELRDNKLLQTESGSAFMKSFNDFYYLFSPTIADYERENPYFKEGVKIAITPMISSLSILNYVDMDSEAEVLGYGISLILLNVGMYAGVPAIVVIGIRKNLNQ